MRIMKKQQKGIVLVIVLWMLVVLIMMVTAYSRMMRTETMLIANLVRSAQANALAEAGVNQAIVELYKPEFERTQKTSGANYKYPLHGEMVKVRIQAEVGKIDLNSARSELLIGLLQSVNVPEQEQLPLAQAILDWRDKDNLARSEGAEDSYYENAGFKYAAKDGLFNSIDELLLVKGFTSELYHKIRPALTIYSHNAGVNPQSAPKEVLLAIPSMTETEVESYIASRNALDEPGQSVLFPGIDPKYLLKRKGTVFLITSEARINNTLARINAVISLRRNGKQPYSIIAWQNAPATTESKQDKLQQGEIEQS